MKTPLEQAILDLEEFQANTEMSGSSLYNIMEQIGYFRAIKLQEVLNNLYDVRKAIESETTLAATRVESETFK
ncbi:hypothetical protein PPYC2_21845 [Paenibacillus polymyxa]|uniref:hypothetical protein n=1 Tax=Paenibacillus polymyxa TaxID=1406 RepID=UPI0008FB470F|nr:hypothetical protein [Paenibacillus polymyxa]APB77429.1 hypothetical protein PPYC2_21845 [Paenibacillus polymyxa]